MGTYRTQSSLFPQQHHDLPEHPGTFWLSASRARKAAKPHTCGYCGGPIARGTQYEELTQMEKSVYDEGPAPRAYFVRRRFHLTQAECICKTHGLTFGECPCSAEDIAF